MGLKIEDLDHELRNRNLFENESMDGASSISARSNNLIRHSMKQAIKAQIRDTKENGAARGFEIDQDSGKIRGPPAQYEKIIQKLEGDIRMHFRVSQVKLYYPISNLSLSHSYCLYKVGTRDENSYGLPGE